MADAARLITGRDIKDGTVTSVDVKNGTLRAADLRAGVVPVVPTATTETVHVADGPDDADMTWTIGAFTLTANCRAEAPPGGEGYRDYLRVAIDDTQNYQIVSTLDADIGAFQSSGPVWFFAPGADTGTIQLWHPSSEQALTIIASRHRGENGCSMVVTTSSTPH